MSMRAKPFELVFILLISFVGSLSVLIVSCTRPPSPLLGYEDGFEWGKKFVMREVKDYVIVEYLVERVFESKREGFRMGFIEGYGEEQRGEEVIQTLFEAADSDEFEEGKNAGERLRIGNTTDLQIWDSIVGNSFKSEGKRAGWRCGFIIGYKGETGTYEEGEAIYRSIESSTTGFK